MTADRKPDPVDEWITLLMCLRVQPIPGWRVLSRRELFARLGLKDRP